MDEHRRLPGVKRRRDAVEPHWPLGLLSSLSSFQTPESGGSKSTEILDKNPKLLLLEVGRQRGDLRCFFSGGGGGQEVKLVDSGCGAPSIPPCDWSPSLL